MKLRIISPVKLFFSSDNVYGVSLPTESGIFFVMANAEPSISLLKEGVIQVFSKANDKPMYTLTIKKGVTNFSGNVCEVVIEV